jgi:hypothetical protein
MPIFQPLANVTQASDIVPAYNNLVNQLNQAFGALNYINVRNPPYNAQGNGITDDTAALQAAADAAQTNAQSTIYIPDGVYPVSVGLRFNCNVIMTPGAVIQATSAMNGASYVVAVGNTTTPVKHKSWNGGVVDAHGYANQGIFIRWVQHYTITQVVVTGAQQYYFHVGDTGSSTASFELHAYDLRCDRANDWWDPGVTAGIVANSIGFYFDNCTDSSLSTSEMIQCFYGCRAAKSSIIFDRVHNYAHAGGFMHYAFWDNAVSNYYINCHADTPSVYGWFFDSTTPNPSLINPRFTINSLSFNPVGIYWNGLSNPTASIVASVFGDASSGGTFAKDMDSTGTLSAANLFLVGTTYNPGTVVTTKNMNTNVYPVTG